MQIISPVPSTKLITYKDEIKDWPKDNKYIASRAINAIENGGEGIACEDDNGSLISIAEFKHYDKNYVVAMFGIRSAFTNLRKQFPNRQEFENHLDKLREEHGLTEYISKIVIENGTLEDDFIPKVPDEALYLDFLAGIGVGGAAAIMRKMQADNKMIFLEMMAVTKNMSFYKHFGFKRFEKTKYMYYMK